MISDKQVQISGEMDNMIPAKARVYRGKPVRRMHVIVKKGPEMGAVGCVLAGLVVSAAVARLSKTSSYCERGLAAIGAHDPLLTGWDEKVTTNGVPKRGLSKMLKRGLFGFIPGYGHEDIMLRKG
jgi:hypothetical protein